MAIGRGINWTPAMDAMLVRMRVEGAPVEIIAAALGGRISRNAIVNRLDRLRMPTGHKFRAIHVQPVGAEIDLDRDPLPAGHPSTWGAITADIWPGIGR
jgi:hypothetical protein